MRVSVMRDIGAVAQQAANSRNSPPMHVADHAADQRRRAAVGDHFDDVEFVRSSRNNRADDQRRLAGQRNAHALQADEASDDEQAISVDEMGDRMHRLGTRRAITYTEFMGDENSWSDQNDLLAVQHGGAAQSRWRSLCLPSAILHANAAKAARFQGHVQRPARIHRSCRPAWGIAPHRWRRPAVRDRRHYRGGGRPA